MVPCVATHHLRPTSLQVCYNLVNFLQRDEQDKQSRIDYLKGLAEDEDKQQVGSGCISCNTVSEPCGREL